jgi:hypothetical protein
MSLDIQLASDVNNTAACPGAGSSSDSKGCALGARSYSEEAFAALARRSIHGDAAKNLVARGQQEALSCSVYQGTRSFPPNAGICVIS